VIQQGRLQSGMLPSGFLLLAFAVLGAAFLYIVGIDALEGRNDFQFFADSNTYHEAAIEGDINVVADAVSVTANFLGPLLILKLTGQNYYLVLLVNVFLMLVTLHGLGKAACLNAFNLLLVLLLNPLTISSLLSVNKEIISLVFFALLFQAYSRKSLLALAAALATSVLVRWQLTVFLVALVGSTSAWNPLRRHRLLSLTAMLAIISVVYLKLAPLLEAVQANFEYAVADYEGSGFFAWLVDLQNEGLYWLIFPVKAAHLLFATGLRIDRLLNPTVIYNDIWQLLHSTATLVLFVLVWRSGRLHLRNDFIYVSAIYIAVFATTPIYAPRYFYPVYVLWALALICPLPYPDVACGFSRRRRPARDRTLEPPVTRSKAAGQN
jgi:hypothetical protein